MSDTRFRATGVLFVAALVVVAAGGILGHGFLNYDDPQMVAKHPRLQDPSIGDAVAAFSEIHEFAYLPVSTLALMPDASLFRGSARGFHAGSLLWHAIGAALVFGFLHALSRSRAVALVAGAIFAVHPLAAESVAWASGRKDQVSFALLVLSLSAALGHLRRGGAGRIVLSAVLLVLACLAKGAALVHPLLCGLLVLFTRADGTASPRARPSILMASSLSVAAALAAVHLIVARAQGTTTPLFFGAWDRLLLFFDATFGYFRHLVAPFGLSIHYELRPGRTGQEIAGAALVAVGVASAFALRRLPPFPRRAFLLSAAWFVAALVPFNGVFPQTAVAMADRYAFVAIPAFALAAATAISLLSPALRVAAAIILVATLCIAAKARYAEFRDSETVFRAALAVDPQDGLALLKLGEALRAGGAANRAEALRLFHAAAATAPDPVREARARLLAMDALLHDGRFADALQESERLLAIERDHGRTLARLGFDRVTVRFNRASALLGAGRRDDALRALDAVLAEDPRHVYARLVRAGLDASDALAALQAGKDGVERDRERERVHKNLGVYEAVLAELASAPRTAEAIEQEIQATSDLSRLLQRADWRADRLNVALMHVETLIRRHPSRPEGFVIRAQLMSDVDESSAADDLRAAAALEPRSNATLRAVANGFLALGRNREAIAALERARLRDPGDPGPIADLLAIYLAAGRGHLEGRGGAPEPKKARDALKLAQAVDSGAADVLAFEAEILDAEGRPEAAFPVWQRVLEGDGRNTKARLMVARGRQNAGLGILANMRRLTESRPAGDRALVREELLAKVAEEFSAAVALAPDAEELGLARSWLDAERRKKTVDPLLTKARAHAEAGRVAEALAAAGEAFALDRAYVASAELCGHLAMQSGDAAQATTAFERTLELDPEHLAANDALARLYAARGDRDKAIERGRRFLALAEGMRDLTPTLREEVDAIRGLVARLEASGTDSRR